MTREGNCIESVPHPGDPSPTSGGSVSDCSPACIWIFPGTYAKEEIFLFMHHMSYSFCSPPEEQFSFFQTWNLYDVPVMNLRGKIYIFAFSLIYGSLAYRRIFTRLFTQLLSYFYYFLDLASVPPPSRNKFNWFPIDFMVIIFLSPAVNLPSPFCFTSSSFFYVPPSDYLAGLFTDTANICKFQLRMRMSTWFKNEASQEADYVFGLSTSSEWCRNTRTVTGVDETSQWVNGNYFKLLQ